MVALIGLWRRHSAHHRRSWPASNNIQAYDSMQFYVLKKFLTIKSTINYGPRS